MGGGRSGRGSLSECILTWCRSCINGLAVNSAFRKFPESAHWGTATPPPLPELNCYVQKDPGGQRAWALMVNALEGKSSESTSP